MPVLVLQAVRSPTAPSQHNSYGNILVMAYCPAYLASTSPRTRVLAAPSHSAAHVVMAYIVMAYTVTAYKNMAYIVMAYIVMAYIGMAYIAMAYIVMAHNYGPI